MSESAANGPSGAPLLTHCDVRVSVEKFGPIEKGSVDLRPLTIFVGPSNTGKTYLAILIYALHRTLQGFPQFPVIERYLFSQEEDHSLTDHELEHIINTLNTDQKSLLFSDLPESMRNSAQRFLNNKEFLADYLKGELKHCFDLESITGLIRMSDQGNATKLSIAVSNSEQELWNFLMEISESDITSKGNINNIELLSERNFGSAKVYERLIRNFRNRLINVSERGMTQDRQRGYLLGQLWEILFQSHREHQVETYYLPAARSGIMQSHRVIASSLVARSTRAGFERFPEIPTFSGVMADFIQRLILYDEPITRYRYRAPRKQTKAMKALADVLERQTLGGQIRTIRSSSGAYPEFVYRPLEAKQDIRLSRASSMVSELAPVVLFIRGNISSGDTLIIEEPEAHLHPAAQTEMAGTLARLVRSGIRVVVTTHSDWLLKGIGNLMREGELEEQSGESARGDLSSSSLRPKDVGIWLFNKEDGTQGSTIREIQFDRIEGIEPSDYEAVDEQLYNRSADLQNRFEEVANQGKT